MSDARSSDAPTATMRLEALGLLAGGVAHDFNNILAVIRANVELARDALTGRPADVAMAMSDLAEVDRAVERASELVRQLLAFGRRQRLAPEALDALLALFAASPVNSTSSSSTPVPGSAAPSPVEGDAADPTGAHA